MRGSGPSFVRAQAREPRLVLIILGAICTKGPKRPMRTLIGLPLIGSTPKSRAWATSSRLTDFSVCFTRR